MTNVYKDTNKMCASTMCQAGDVLNELYIALDMYPNKETFGIECERILTEFTTGNMNEPKPTVDNEAFNNLTVRLISINNTLKTTYLEVPNAYHKWFGCLITLDEVRDDMKSKNGHYVISGFVTKVDRFDGERYPHIQITSCAPLSHDKHI